MGLSSRSRSERAELNTRLDPAALGLELDATVVDDDSGAKSSDLDALMRFESVDSMDPVLEIWIGGTPSVVTVRLVGILDRTTRGRLLSVMGELVTERVECFVVDGGQAAISDASGAEALALLRRLIRETGRTLLWEGVDFDQPRRAVIEVGCDASSAPRSCRRDW